MTKGVRLTENDNNILNFLALYKCASTATLWRVFYKDKTLRAAQKRLKRLYDGKVLKRSRDNVLQEWVYYRQVKPTQWKHSLILSSFVGKLHEIGVKIIKEKRPYEVGSMVADGLLVFEFFGKERIALIEVCNTNYMDIEKYEKMYRSRVWVNKFGGEFPLVIALSDKKVKESQHVKPITLKTDFSDLENLLFNL